MVAAAKPDDIAHYLPTESTGYADALTATPNGPETAPTRSTHVATSGSGVESSYTAKDYGVEGSGTKPRSPIMHITRGSNKIK
jgi:hypothetical protein